MGVGGVEIVVLGVAAAAGMHHLSGAEDGASVPHLAILLERAGRAWRQLLADALGDIEFAAGAGVAFGAPEPA